MSLFGFGKSEEEKELEKRIDIFSKFFAIQKIAATVPIMRGLDQHQKVVTALFFDCAVCTLLADLEDGKVEDRILAEILVADETLAVEGKHINIARSLAQLQKDEKAARVANEAENALSGLLGGEDTRASLSKLLSDKTLVWEEISLDD